MAMQARISTIEGDAGKIDDAVKIINEKILPALKGLEGFTAANFWPTGQPESWWRSPSTKTRQP
jgi:hypothetical protein